LKREPPLATFEDGTVDTTALIGGEAEGKPITNVAEAVQAIDTMNFDALDAQLAADLADIEASFE
jgi:predicted kinase